MLKKIEDISPMYKNAKILEENPISKWKISIKNLVANGRLIEEKPKNRNSSKKQ